MPGRRPAACPAPSRAFFRVPLLLSSGAHASRSQAPAGDAEQGADADTQRLIAEAFAASAAARAPRPPKGAPKEAKERGGRAKPLVPLPPAPTVGDGSEAPKPGVARWAGPAFSMSPAPDALPMPTFSGTGLLSRSASTPLASLLQAQEPAAKAQPSMQQISATVSEPTKPQQRQLSGPDASQALRAMLNMPAAAAPPPQQQQMHPQMQMMPPHMQMQQRPQQMMPPQHMQQPQQMMHGMPPHMQHMQQMMQPPPQQMYGQPPQQMMYGQPPPNMGYRPMPPMHQQQPMPPMHQQQPMPPVRPQQTPASQDKSAALRMMLGVS